MPSNSQLGTELINNHTIQITETYRTDLLNAEVLSLTPDCWEVGFDTSSMIDRISLKQEIPELFP